MADVDAFAAQLRVHGEPEEPASHHRSERASFRVVVAEDGDVLRRLVANEVALEVAIVVPGEAVEVVWRDVEHGGDVRAAIDELQLRVADLQHGPGVGTQRGQVLEQADADVPADEDGPLIGAEHLGDEGGRG